jgi:spore germination protein
VVLFGDRLAKEKGILDLIDSFQRDPSIGARLFLAETEGESKSVITGEYGERGNAIYLSNLIRHNMKSKDVPKTDLQRFMVDFNQKGKTPYLPRLKKLSKENVEISGLSFFRYGHVVDTIPADKMFYFKLLVDKYSQGTLKVNLGKTAAAIESIRSNYKVRLTARNPLKVQVIIHVKAILNEYSGVRITPGKIRKIENKLENEIEIECEKLTKRFQSKNIDPVGFGHFIKSKTRGFNFTKWETDYKDLKVNVQANVSITESGVIE